MKKVCFPLVLLLLLTFAVRAQGEVLIILKNGKTIKAEYVQFRDNQWIFYKGGIEGKIDANQVQDVVTPKSEEEQEQETSKVISEVKGASVFAKTLDVLIKGVDDGIKTNRQQDYQEAVMNAKLQAVERAGVEITSITRVTNFQLKYDMVESKADAVLLPGFRIMDVGYQTDGTYQVVLSGKIQTASLETDEMQTRKNELENKRAKNRKSAIQEEISGMVERIRSMVDAQQRLRSAWREELRKADRTYNDCMNDVRRHYNQGYFDQPGQEPLYKVCVEGTDRLKENINRDFQRAIDQIENQKMQLESRLSELRIELAEYQ